jgi:hypothetical protein
MPHRVTPTGGGERVRTATPTVRNGSRSRALGVTLVVLAVLFAVVLVLAYLHWGRLNPGTVGFHIAPAEQSVYSVLLLLSSVTASVSLASCALLIGSWLERRRPRVHRFVARAYLVAGVYPTVFLALVVESRWPFSVATAISEVAFYALWTAVTTYAVVLGRRGRTDEHARWMLRSFALTASILLRRVLVDPLVLLLLSTELHTTLGGSMNVLYQLSDSNSDWLGVMIAVVVGEWIIERRRTRATRLTRYAD